MAAAAPILLAGSEAFGVFGEFIEQERAWREAAKPNEHWLPDNARALAKVSVGCSFAPEQWPAADQARGEPLRALEFAVQQLGMREVRLGLRWNRIEVGDNGIDLSPYEPYLDYLLENGVNLCLNLGPIKTFRWPEEHVPGFVFDRVTTPPKHGTVHAHDPIADEAASYLERLLDRLSGAYGAALLGGVTTIQVENEPFSPLGRHMWKLSAAYLRRLVTVVDGYLPNARILITSSGRLKLRSVRGLFLDLLSDSDHFAGRLVLGFDYHFKTTTRDAIPVVRWLDPVSFGHPGSESCSANLRASREAGYGIEVSEAQAEPFGYLMEPGNSARFFRFVLGRCAAKVLDAERPSIIRVWGIEELAKKALGRSTTSDHEEIFALIREINASGARGGV